MPAHTTHSGSQHVEALTTHHPTPVTSAPIPLTSSQSGTRTHGHQVTQHGLQALPMPCVCWTVCGQCLCDPLCLLRWFTPHSKQCHPLGCIASRHQGPSAGMGKPVHPRTHTHAQAYGVARDAQPPVPPLMCLQGPLSCTACSCAFTGTYAAVGDIPPLPCCAIPPSRSSPLLGTWPSAFHHGALLLPIA